MLQNVATLSLVSPMVHGSRKELFLSPYLLIVFFVSSTRQHQEEEEKKKLNCLIHVHVISFEALALNASRYSTFDSTLPLYTVALLLELILSFSLTSLLLSFSIITRQLIFIEGHFIFFLICILECYKCLADSSSLSHFTFLSSWANSTWFLVAFSSFELR